MREKSKGEQNKDVGPRFVVGTVFDPVNAKLIKGT